jgi:hypothetical protein
MIKFAALAANLNTFSGCHHYFISFSVFTTFLLYFSKQFFGK